MENKQLIEYKENFISKVRKFFKNLFWKISKIIVVFKK